MTATRNDPQRKRLEDHTEPIIGISAPDHGNHPFYHSLDSKLVDKATHWNQTRAAGQSFLRKPRLRSDSPDALSSQLFFLHTSQVPCFSGRFRLFHDQKSTRFRGVRTGRPSDYPSVFSLLARSRFTTIPQQLFSSNKSYSLASCQLPTKDRFFKNPFRLAPSPLR